MWPYRILAVICLAYLIFAHAKIKSHLLPERKGTFVLISVFHAPSKYLDEVGIKYVRNYWLALAAFFVVGGILYALGV